MGSAPQDKETPEVDEKSRETALGHILLESTDKEYASETHSIPLRGYPPGIEKTSGTRNIPGSAFSAG